ncbi:MAG: 50S ribosomal protein L11 methyltransferase [Flavobacteriaceae bacterium]|nr:50S ribosomal protein L11 methyltransferase [Flavobacteriaceae bacterium]
MKNYRAYHFKVSPSNSIEIVSAWLTTFPFESYVQTKQGVTAYVQEAEVAEISIEDCLAVPFDGVDVIVETEDIAAQNWNASWEEKFHPIRVDDWTVRASFHKPSQTPNELIIDPKMSFGTGHHATTQLMLSQLIKLPCMGLSVLDVGTGTGVLAIAAKKKGAAHVVGIDIEDWCVENANENAEKNNATAIAFSTNDVTTLTSTKYDIVLANINRNVLLEHLPTYAGLLAPEGVLLLSGFHLEDVTVLTELAEKHKLSTLSQTAENGWICLKFILSLV